ncbi:3-deoxy-D-manno-octulosonic-acid transferase [Abditibacterium utsteinense]|uniref:3-deoxy-D-manno-octulosonic acid transferase n=1 Tax=Abditibacterium utsteinense TaxID=1960156 RepID=A0A2S8SX67_9BACT|nr:glycosyltransferase N-terminal domain-containing protein [Abditibacterium utsteinense]PQV65386.1 3-deoxy-D-manno-octulosonic-acid transferase [Abditibacterium utsteinense]
MPTRSANAIGALPLGLKRMKKEPVSHPTNRRVLPILLRDMGVLVCQVISPWPYLTSLRRMWGRFRFLKRDWEFYRACWTVRFRAEVLPASTSPIKEETDEHKRALRVMLVTLGWGEVVGMEPLIAALRQARPDLHLMLTVKSHEAIIPASRLGDSPIIPLPSNCVLPVARYIDRSRPDIVVFYERFDPVILLRGLHLKGVPFVLLHARMQRSLSGSRLSVAFKKWQLQGLRAICLASAKDLPGAQQILPAHVQVHVTGSTKFPPEEPRLDAEHAAELQNWVESASGGAPILVAGSTHEGEEEWVLTAFQMVRDAWPASHPAPVLILAPRRPVRGEQIVPLLNARKLRFARRSDKQGSNNFSQIERCDVLLLDTLGELAYAYRFGVSAFVGGSITAETHNVTEPLIWSIPVAYGPLRCNFESEQRACEAAGVGFRVSTPAELAAHWTEILNSASLRKKLGEQAQQLVVSQSDALQKTLQVVLEAIDAINTDAPHTSHIAGEIGCQA